MGDAGAEDGHEGWAMAQPEVPNVMKFCEGALIYCLLIRLTACCGVLYRQIELT